MNRTRLFLVDDHVALRQAVQAALSREPDFEVVGAASDGAEGLTDIARLAPDVVILDVKMPEVGGIAALPRVFAASPRSRVLMFTMYENPTYVHSAIAAGATGYVLKNAGFDDLLRAIRSVARGAAFFQTEITRTMLRRLALDAKLEAERGSLTVRELQVLELLADGRTNKEIAQRLGVSDETVKSALKRIFDKLEAADRTEAVARALRQRLIE